VLNKEKNDYFTEKVVTYSIQQTFDCGIIQPLYLAISQNDLAPIRVQNEDPFNTLITSQSTNLTSGTTWNDKSFHNLTSYFME